MTSIRSDATGQRTPAARSALAVLNALGVVGSGAALVATSAPWWAVMTTGLIATTLQLVVVLVPAWFAHRRALTAEILADRRQRTLIALKAVDVDVTSDDLRASGPGVDVAVMSVHQTNVGDLLESREVDDPRIVVADHDAAAVRCRPRQRGPGRRA